MAFAQWLDVSRVAEGENPIEKLRRIVKALQKLSMLGGGRDEDDVYIHLVLILASAKHYRLLQCFNDTPKVLYSVFTLYQPYSLTTIFFAQYLRGCNV